MLVYQRVCSSMLTHRLQVCCSSPLLVIARAARGGNVELLALEAAIGPYGAQGAVAARRLGRKNGGIPFTNMFLMEFIPAIKKMMTGGWFMTLF